MLQKRMAKNLAKKPVVPFDSVRRKKFLKEFASEGVLVHAAYVAGVAPETVYDWQQKDPAFKIACKNAKDLAIATMEVEARHRAVNGVTVKVLYDDDGNEIGVERKKSDTMLIFLLKAAKPDKYRDNMSIDHNVHTDGTTNDDLVYDFTRLTSSERDTLEALLDKAAIASPIDITPV